MVEDIVDTKRGRGHVEIRTGIGRKRRWPDEEKGRIVAEAVAPGAVVAEVARRYDLTPQHLFGWIRAAKDGKFALPADGAPAFVPVVVEPARTSKAALRERSVSIEIAIGAIKVRVRNGADARTVEAVLRAVRRASS
jgi:transposase